MKNFCIDGEIDKVFEYNPYTKEIRKTNIYNICEENYLYDIRNEKGEFVFPELKNKFEDALSIIESGDEKFLRDLLDKVENANDVIFLSNEERENLLGFAFLMVFRNPKTREILPEALSYIGGPELNNKAEKTYAWQIVMSMLEQFAPKNNSAQITFLKTNKINPFITSGMPMYFTGNPIQKDFYMPLSSTLAFELRLPSNLLVNLDRCEVKKLLPADVDNYNGKILMRECSLISSSKEKLQHYIHFMDECDRSNVYTLSCLNMLEEMDACQFQILVTKLIEEELRNNNEYICSTFFRLKDRGIDEKNIIKTISESIGEQIKKDIICNHHIEFGNYNDILKKL